MRNDHALTMVAVSGTLVLSLAIVPMPFVACLDAAAPATEPGLLFCLSGERGWSADHASGGDPEPSFVANVRIIDDGARGRALECGHTQLLSYWAPGNIYAQRGTLAFFWRAREPVGPTPFPVFRVGYADHSSWDMVFLRLDYSGHGFDAFVTDASLARTRVTVDLPEFPDPQQWIHLAFAWDEMRGVRFWVNGRLVARKEGVAVYDAALDQFGPHSRIISPYQVQSDYNFVRGGDIDEVRVYDRMLADANVAALARSQQVGELPPLERNLGETLWRDEWWLRYGWNRAGDPPPRVMHPSTTIRKVEIHEVRDVKRWWWKATDGIRETTWPGVYNRSRLPGRNDYFQLPDWDCYSISGRAVTFTLPDEPWNHLEISGAAFGEMSLIDVGDAAVDGRLLFDRPPGQERTFHRLPEVQRGGGVRFENVEQETPIGELVAYNVRPGLAPRGIVTLNYQLTALAEPDHPSVQDLVRFIAGRFPADERTAMVALPAGAPRNLRPGAQTPGLPLIHILVPSEFRAAPTKADERFSYTWENMNVGLDGIVVELPALNVRPTHGDLFALNLRVMDPIWPLRRLLDFTFAVKPGEAHTLWLDTRDRILPNGKGLYLTLTGAGPDLVPSQLEGGELHLVFKPREEARVEHEIDRFTQIRDLYGHMLEEHTNSRRFNLFNRFEADVSDLLRVNPDHQLGRQYWYDANPEQAPPPFTQPAPPAGVPVWAFRQVEALRRLKQVILWWIDNRQIENGEFGGGLSDDGDLTSAWPGAAFMGCAPARLKDSVLREMEAYYQQGMFTNGLPTIQTDELHSYEEGLQVLGQAMLMDFGKPRHLERAMETARAVERLTAVNGSGHRHIRSSYFSGTKVATDGVWGVSKPDSYLILHPVISLVEYNGNPRARQWLLELADGLLAHRKKDAQGRYRIDTTIHFESDQGQPSELGRVWPLFWSAYRWTRDKRYLQPLLDEQETILSGLTFNALDQLGLRKAWNRKLAAPSIEPLPATLSLHVLWQMTGNKRYLEDLYAGQIQAAALREYINTEGHPWTDRVTLLHEDLQRARLGGIALVRNIIFSGHAVSWHVSPPGSDESLAVLIPDATQQRMKIIVYNLEHAAVEATLTGWDVAPGRWQLRQGVDKDGDDAADTEPIQRIVDFERSSDLRVNFAPRSTTVVTLELLSHGRPYWSRPDLGIDQGDVSIEEGALRVTVHSLGSVATPATRVALVDSSGRAIAAVPLPSLPPPLDLQPRTATVRLTMPSETSLSGCRMVIDPDSSIEEITRANNDLVL